MECSIRDRIYLSKPRMGGAERKYVLDALDSGWIAPGGRYVKEFESRLGEMVEGRSVVAVSSGTAALEVGLRLLGVESGDEVMCSTFTFIGSANPIRYMGAKPVFVDSERGSWQIDVGLLEEGLRKRAKRNKLPKALVVANIYGQAAELDRIMEVCREYGVKVMEDAAEGLGGSYKGKAMGAWGDMGIFSFNGNKMVTTSAGGALVLPDEKEDMARHLIKVARLNGGGFEHDEVGYNYGMSNILAALGVGQLEVLDDYVICCRALYERYKDAFGHLEFMGEVDGSEGTRWLSSVLLPEGVDVARVIVEMEARGIELRRLWKPLHLQKPYEGSEVLGGQVSEYLWGRGVCLPSSVGMTVDEQGYVIKSLKEVM